MQSNDDLYSTDTNPVLASYQGYDQQQAETTTPGETDNEPVQMMPIAGANETATADDENEGTDDEQDTNDEDDANSGEESDDEEDVNDDGEAELADDDVDVDDEVDDTDEDDEDEEDEDGTVATMNGNMSITNESDKGGIY